MPLNPATLTEEILKLTDASRPDHVGWPVVFAAPDVIDEPATLALVAQNWAAAMGAFFAEMTQPSLLPGTIESGKSAFTGAFQAALGKLGSPTGLVALQNGLVAMTAVLAAGILPPNVGLPPVGPPPVVFGPPIADPVIPAATLATTIFTWTKTGLFGPPPAAPTTPWS